MSLANPPVNQSPVAAGTFREREVWRSHAGSLAAQRDRIAEEVPIALLYNGQPHVVMLATPQDLDDFAVGFTLSEGILPTQSEIGAITRQDFAEGIEVTIEIPFERQAALAGRERNLAGRTGCGLCGSRTLAQAVRKPAPVGTGVTISEAALQRALTDMASGQVLNSMTGAVHAAAWARRDGSVTLVREDVGRHNALDKLIGALARSGADLNDGFITVTSRASYEMVQKAATAGASIMVAVSAPTDLAIRLAEETGFTLVGFARTGSYVVYANPQRLISRQDAA